MSTRVSVVVPVHNPGPAIESTIASLLDQSLPATAYEVILVDDGSTDDSPARLDEVAAEQPNVKVIHIPASGAPGRPRNIGLEAAQGEYVHFVDADDTLAPRALEWLTGMADRYGSDVVIGKYASATLERSQVLFTHSRPHCSLTDTHELMTASWAPAKLFRTAFLRRHGIVFPEGWRWMEDQLFVLRAYMAAGRNIAVFADEPCYFFVQRDEGGHLSSEDLDPETHVAHLQEVFDVIEGGISAGTLRERLLRRFYRANVLSRLDHRYLEADPDLRRRTFESFHRFVVARVGRSIDASFGGAHRVRTRLLRAGDAEALLTFIQRFEDLDLHAVLTALEWRHGRLVLDARAEIRHGVRGTPLTFITREGGTWLDPQLTGDIGELVDAEIGSTWGRVSLIEPKSALEWLVPAPFALLMDDEGPYPAGGRRRRPYVVASVEVEPDRVGPGHVPLQPGDWSTILRWRGFGFGGASAPRPNAAVLRAGPLPAVLGDPPWLIVPRPREDGLTIEVGGPGLRPDDWRPSATRVDRDGHRLEVMLPIAAASGAGRSTAVIVLQRPEGDQTWPAEVIPDLGRLRLRSLEPDFGDAESAATEAPLLVRLGPPLNAEVSLGRARVAGDGRIRVIGPAIEGQVARAIRRAAWRARSTAGRARGVVRDAAVNTAVRLPHPLRLGLIRVYRAVRSRRP